MDSIQAQKLQAMGNYKKTQFVYNLVLYSLTAFLSTLFYLYLFCFPSMRQFLFDFLPNVYSFFSSPTFLFIFGNIIVIFLVGESKLAGSRSASPAAEIYDEYVERSRSLRRQSVHVECKRKDGNPEMGKEKKNRIRRHCSLNNIRCLDVRKKEMAAGGRSVRRPPSVVQHKDERLTEMHANDKTAVSTQDDDISSIRCLEDQKKKETVGQSLTRPLSLGRLDMQYDNRKTNMATQRDDLHNIRSLEGKKKATVVQSLPRPMSFGTLMPLQYENNEKTTMGAGRDDDLCNNSFAEEKKKETVSQILPGRLHMPENEESSHDCVNKMSLAEKRKKMEQSMDELNRRVEEFIARVNRQRMLEDSGLVEQHQGNNGF